MVIRTSWSVNARILGKFLNFERNVFSDLICHLYIEMRLVFLTKKY